MARILSDLDVAFDTFDWTLERYHAAIEAGILTENDRVELIYGQLRMKTPVGEEHSAFVEFLHGFFFRRFGTKFRLRAVNPVPIPTHSEPQPDFVIARKMEGTLQLPHPKPEEVHLVIEVAQSTLKFDRSIKARLYAEAGLAEYWILNLANKEIEVHINPDKVAGKYRGIASYALNDRFHSPFLGEFAVSELPFTDLDE